MAYVIQGETGDWELVIGLEVHAQVISKAKLFSGAATEFGAEPNSQVSFVDAGFPGMLPVINALCVEQAVRTGLGLKAQINLTSVFARKNYFYADLPQGYQISQYELPIVGEGTLLIDLPDGTTKAVGIERLHLEQDAGKSMHDQHPTKSFIDLNRSGVALMEIVSKPDMRSPEEAGAYLTKLRTILRYLETCDGNMQEGSMRCDANVSVRPVGEQGLRTRCEIKNVNSIRFVQQAIEYEARRHIDVYESGGDIRQETRLFDSGKGETRSMRSKEHAHDYRYFPDPDLLPLVIGQNFVDGIKATLPELPDDKKARFMADFGLNAYDAGVLVAERASADFFEEVAKGRDSKMAANWIMGDFFATMNSGDYSWEKPPVTAANLGGMIDLIKDGTISTRLAKDVFIFMVESGKSPAAIVEEKGLKQVTDTGAIEKAIDEVFAANPDKVAEVKGGKDKLMGWFVGQVMKATQGKANPAMLNELIAKKFKE
ncbi:Asp-tRNA(Asn)/Glu-tRNA(Gln) amidotransferase subunit GatB [Magnetospirillum moscoviense]|uniref:Aspartyl/glutamyl-tRNA(Asn/Gln) amidotransferase subunit B n=1 Tax=Magnetospirillum moscoviense TaxID=1437059 RepID=A0A178MLF4_9PROT|nr:Asp-tRNA(Asn)/Glu-tRNA(Gln) amidotransferase subunit GatB [Magnetospirillum moscoviense]OAN48948.1 aspartyl/glutamyl-tRNA amidotransferase subunit B [Magnetospirillum moscoviense]